MDFRIAKYLNRIGLSLLLFSPLQGFSHGGGLNSEGCHNNRKIGEYHCHRSSKTTHPKDLQTQPEIIIDNGQSAELPMLSYNRDLYGFETYPTETNRGFYTGLTCNTNIDHVVSLKDAHDSGAGRWEASYRVEFANDKSNHVPSCLRINSSKSSSTPRDFLRKGSDGQGMDYEIKPKCAYLGIYYQVKQKYGLSFSNNDPELFQTCGLHIAK